MAVENKRPESSPADAVEETSSLERADETASPTAEESPPDVAPEAEEAAREARTAEPAGTRSSSGAGQAAQAGGAVRPENAESGDVDRENASSEESEARSSLEDGDDGSSLERNGEDVIYVRRSEVRRTPKYGRFIGLGVVLGAILAVALAQFGEIQGDGSGIGYSRRDLMIVLAITLVPLGAIAGGVIAMLFDRRNNKRHRP